MAEISFSRRLGELAVLCDESVQVCTFVREQIDRVAAARGGTGQIIARGRLEPVGGGSDGRNIAIGDASVDRTQVKETDDLQNQVRSRAAGYGWTANETFKTHSQSG